MSDEEDLDFDSSPDLQFVASHEDAEIDEPEEPDDGLDAEIAEMARIDRFRIDWDAVTVEDVSLFGSLGPAAAHDDTAAADDDGDEDGD